jgi:TPR repeat protein
MFYTKIYNKYDEAFKWFLKSADQGDDIDILEIGKLYHLWLKNYDDAMKWYIKSYKMVMVMQKIILKIY